MRNCINYNSVQSRVSHNVFEVKLLVLQFDEFDEFDEYHLLYLVFSLLKLLFFYQQCH